MVLARWADSIAASRLSLLPMSTPSESTITALRPGCFFISSSEARKTAS